MWTPPHVDSYENDSVVKLFLGGARTYWPLFVNKLYLSTIICTHLRSLRVHVESKHEVVYIAFSEFHSSDR